MFQIFHHQYLFFFHRGFYLLNLFLLTTGLSFAQQRQFTNQRHFTVEDGLPQSYVTSILQDDDGFLWVSTLDGLSRYDGRDFKTFRYNPDDPNGLATSVITGRGKLEDNNLTLYYNAFQSDEFNVQTFKVSENTVRLRLNKMENIFWKSYRMGTNTGNWFFIARDGGIGWINYKTNKVSYASKKNGLLDDDHVSAIVQSQDGKIYVVNENGVQVGDTSAKKFKRIPFATHIKPMDDADYEDDFSDRFFIASLPGSRIAIEQDRHIILLDVNKKTSGVIPIPEPRHEVSTGTYSLQVDSKGRLYFEDHGRVFRLDENNKLTLLWEYTGPPTRISAIYIDRSDVLWVSVNAEGLLKIDLHALYFESFGYTHSFVTDMLNRMEGGNVRFPSFWNDPQGAYYFRQASDSKGNRYFCNNWYSGGEIFQSNPGGFRKFSHTPNMSYYSAMFVMPDDALWLFDQEEIAWNVWETPDAQPRKLKVDRESFFNVELADARYLGDYIWCSTSNDGLFQMDGAKLVKKYYGPQANGAMPGTLTEICPDPVDQNKFWIGSRGGGLILWDVHKGLQRVYTMKDGLPNNTIYCILPDKNGQLWCSTNKGIFRFNTASGQIRSFEKTDGLTSNEFNRAHKFKFPDGRLAFGGLEGYTIFNPADFDPIQKTEGTPVLLTGLEINNEPQGAGTAGNEYHLPLSALSKIELPYNKNYLRFEFAAMQFNQPSKIKYRYQLTGVDARWINNGNSNVASYAALPPGNYVFRINATDENGLWSDDIREVKIVIHHPFWATWWAWVIYGSMFILLARWYFLFRENRIRMSQNLAFEKREAVRLREIDEMKDRFFSNVTHEFRTPLTLIVTPLEQLENDSSLSTVALNNIKITKQNTDQLLRLINEFLDFAKLDKGQLKLKESTGEFDLYISNRIRSFELAAGEKNIELDFITENITGNYLFDAEKWGKIINNLLSNAIKFTPSGGRIKVSLFPSGDNDVQLTVEDNGPGIPAEQQKKVFERFYQADDSARRSFGGTGIGLALVKELVELMGGNIILESKQAVFTRFVATVPLKKSPAIITETPKVTTPKANTGSPGTSEHPLLLVAEDNDELRAFLVEMMKKNYRVLEAADGVNAWDVILNELPDIVISDVMMPGMDGFHLCNMSKEDNRTAHIGFILLTSKAAHDSVLKGLGTGADDYITKPFSLEELELRLENLTQLQKKQREWLQNQINQSDPSQKPPEVSNPFLIQLFKEIDAGLDDPRMGVDHLCKAMGMSRSTLNRKLKSLLNTSTNDFIRKYRLQKASGLIREGSDIASAAYKTGFSSPSYFSQCFKEQYGLTPSEWLSKPN